MVPQKPQQPERYSMMRDVRKEFAREDQVAGGWEQPLHLEVNTMRWMKEHQHSYTDAQLDFWLLLRPLTDSSKELSRHFVRGLLSVWHWASALDPPVCPPAPSIAWHRPLAVGGSQCRWYAIVDRGIHMHSSMHGQGLCGLILDCGWQNHGPGSKQFGQDLHDCNQHADSPACH